MTKTITTMPKWRVKVWEVGRERPIETEHHGDLTQKEVVEFFGLKQPDVVKYEVTEIK